MNLFNHETPRLPFKIPDGEGYHFKYDKVLNAYIIVIPNGKLIYAEHFFDKRISDRS